MNFTKIYNDLSHLIFPQACLVCDGELTQKEKQVCYLCDEDLERTNFHQYAESTPMDQLFWGRVEVKATYAHFFYEKRKAVQQLLHNLKYKNNKDIGRLYGAEIARNLLEAEWFKNLDALIPIPLHPVKEFKRGYNQSEVLANGISAESEIKMVKNALVRTKNSVSQTKKSRFERNENVQNKFALTKEISKLKNIALVDDVITTASTLESIIGQINQDFPEINVYVITLAIAK